MLRTLFQWIVFVSAGAVALAAAAEPAAPYDARAALATSQAVVGAEVGDYTFVDTAHRRVRLSDFAGRPVVLSLVYTACYHTCPMTTQNLARAVRVAREALGEDAFTVLTIGFDTRHDTPEAMAQFARQQKVADPNWYFLSGDAETLQALMREVGFLYFDSPKGFDHIIQATVLDGGRRVYRQVYGELFDPPLLVEPLKELKLGNARAQSTAAGLLDRIRFFCTVYDPASGAYRFDYSLFVGLAIGVLLLGATLVWIVREFSRSRRELRQV